MEKLSTRISKNGFLYTLIKRTETKAMYEQRTKDGLLISHEVFKVKVIKEGEVFGTVQPEHEKFPSNEDFGVTAWSVKNRELAEIKYENIVFTEPVLAL